MALPVKLLAAIGTAAGAASAVVFFSSTTQDGARTTLSTTSVESAPLDPWTDLCARADDDDDRESPGPASSCPGAPPQPDPGGPGDAGEGDSAAGGGTCASCGAFDDPFGDPWLNGSDPTSVQPGRSPSVDGPLAALEERIRELESTAYFEVVNEQTGNVVFSVGPNGARFFAKNGARVAAIGTTDLGGYFAARSPVGHQATIGASDQSAGVRIFDGNVPSAELGAHAGPHALRFPSGKGLIAGLGQSRAGSGAVIMGAWTGVSQGSITVTDGRAVVALSKDSGPGGAVLAEALIGGGVLDLANARGDSAVKMGHNGHRYGIVLAGPVPGFPYVPRSGLPGSYFMGCASGEKPACMPEVSPQ